MRFLKLMAVAALGLTTLSGQAHAAKIFTLTGTVAPNTSGSGIQGFNAPFPTTQGSISHILRITFSHPVTGVVGTSGVVGGYNEYDKNGVLREGNNFPFGMAAWFNDASTGIARLNLPTYTVPWDNPNTGNQETLKGIYTSGQQLGTIELSGMSGPINYIIEGFAGVPEPSTWALMILGFGGIGAAMRRRARVVPATV